MKWLPSINKAFIIIIIIIYNLTVKDHMYKVSMTEIVFLTVKDHMYKLSMAEVII